MPSGSAKSRGGWFRVYERILNDSVLWNMSFSDRWDWLCLLATASQEGKDGRLPNIDQIVFNLRLREPDAAITVLERLSERGLIDKAPGGENGWQYAIHHWSFWQFKSDSSTERSQQSRAAAKAAAASPRAGGRAEQSKAYKENSKESQNENSDTIEVGNVLMTVRNHEVARGLAMDKWVRLLNAVRKTRQWNSKVFGPMPGQPGCLVPADLVEASDGKEWSEI